MAGFVGVQPGVQLFHPGNHFDIDFFQTFQVKSNPAGLALFQALLVQIEVNLARGCIQSVIGRIRVRTGPRTWQLNIDSDTAARSFPWWVDIDSHQDMFVTRLQTVVFKFKDSQIDCQEFGITPWVG